MVASVSPGSIITVNPDAPLSRWAARGWARILLDAVARRSARSAPGAPGGDCDRAVRAPDVTEP
jgi:hypothetical protein